MPEHTKRAIGVYRVSEQGERPDDSFQSPGVQQAAIRKECERLNFELVEPMLAEIDVSGGSPLEKRKGLLPAIQVLETGQTNVIIFADFSRMLRDLEIQQQIIRRVEAAGGDLYTIDVGKVTNGNAAKQLTNNVFGAMVQYFRQSVAEKSAEGQQRALEQGHWPLRLIPGYRRTDDGTIEVDPDTGPAVAEAFRLRAGGATVAAVRDHLDRHGIVRSYHGTTSLLGSRVALGELKFGDQLGRVDPLIDLDTFERVQRAKKTRGRKAKSDRLLARLGVLRCGSCGGRMVVGTQGQGGNKYRFYRCGGKNGAEVRDCPRPMYVSAPMVEDVVWSEVKRWVAEYQGSATADGDHAVARAADRYERAKAALETAIRSFTSTGLGSEPAAIDRLSELKTARDKARDLHDRAKAGSTATTRAVTVGDPDELDLAERRELIVTVIDRVLVAPGRGADRITIEARDEAT